MYKDGIADPAVIFPGPLDPADLLGKFDFIIALLSPDDDAQMDGIKAAFVGLTTII